MLVGQSIYMGAHRYSTCGCENWCFCLLHGVLLQLTETVMLVSKPVGFVAVSFLVWQ